MAKVTWAALKFPPINLWNVWRSNEKTNKGTEPRHQVEGSHYKGFTNTRCEFYPCHDISRLRNPDEFNCLHCTCPLYWLECPGSYVVIRDADGVNRKDCSSCTLPHDGYDRSWRLMNLSSYQRKPRIWEGK